MFYWLLSAGIFGYFLNTDVCSQSLMVIRNSCSRVRELRKIKKNLNITITFRMFFITCWLLWASVCLIVSQWLNKNVIMIGKNRYMVTFSIGGKRYSTIIKHNAGPSPIMQAVDGNDNDITALVEPYVLFESENITPGDLGIDNLSIMRHDGTDSEYNKNDTIKL